MFARVVFKLLKLIHRRLGSPMGGAFLIWDELIGRLAREYDHFLLALVWRMFDVTRTDSTTHVVADAEAEATYLWLMHLVGDNHSVTGGEAKESLQADLMKWCCLYPGYWTRRSGQKLLDDGDEQFRDRWEDLFEASKLQEQDLVIDASGGGWKMLVDTRDASSQVARVEASKDEHGGSRGGWARTTIAPSLAIGMV